jgi:hypothetical protein
LVRNAAVALVMILSAMEFVFNHALLDLILLLRKHALLVEMDIIGMEVVASNFVQLVKLLIFQIINASAQQVQTGLVAFVLIVLLEEFITLLINSVNVQLEPDGTDLIVLQLILVSEVNNGTSSHLHVNVQLELNGMELSALEKKYALVDQS